MEKFSSWLSPLVFVFFAAALGVTASTTIGTDITTGGNLDVTGNAAVTGTLGVTGTTTLSDHLDAIGADFTGSVNIDVNDDETQEFSLTLVEPEEEGEPYPNMSTATGWYHTGTLSVTGNFSTEGGTTNYLRVTGDGAQVVLSAQSPANEGVGVSVLAGSSGPGAVRFAFSTTGGGTSGDCYFLGALPGPTTAQAVLGNECNSLNACSWYYDNDTENEWCVCNGTNWVAASDGGVCTNPV